MIFIIQGFHQIGKISSIYYAENRDAITGTRGVDDSRLMRNAAGTVNRRYFETAHLC